MADGTNGSNTSDMAGARRQAALAEYKSLRDETLKRIEFRYQIFSLTLIAAGTFLTIGTGENGSRPVLLLFPIVSFFFAASFIYNTMLLVEIGAYIRNVLEKSGVIELGWATYLKPKYKGIEFFELISNYGLFLGLQLVCFLAFFYQNSPLTELTWILLVLSIVAFVSTLALLLYQRPYHNKVLEADPKT
jgi:4-hydroxybenzoate polyprenyltransferase